MSRLKLFIGICCPWLALGLCLPLSITAQTTQNVSTEIISFTGEIDLAQDAIVFTATPVLSGRLFSDAALELRNGDLYLSYRLAPKPRKLEYLTGYDFIFDGRTVQPQRADLIRSDHGKEEAFQQQLILLDVRQWAGRALLPFTIEISITLLEILVDCSQEPVFGFKEKLPFLLGGVVGAGMVTTGLLLVRRSEAIYDNDYVTQTKAADAEPILARLNRKNKTGVWLTYGGTALLVGDAVWYFIRQAKFRKARSLYQENCQPPTGLRLQPELDITTGSVGVHFTFSF